MSSYTKQVPEGVINDDRSRGVTREQGGGPPRVTLSSGDTRMKRNVTEFIKNIGQHDVERWELWSCDETTAKKVHHFVASFLGKNRGDTVSCRPR